MNRKPLSRRKFTALAGLSTAALGLGGLPAPARAAPGGWPNQLVRIVVPYPAGGATDVLARLIAQQLQARWGQTVIVENRPGASGAIGIGSVVKSPADGHTVVIGITTMILHTPALMPHVSYDVHRDLRPLAKVADVSLVFVVPRRVPADTLEAFIALVRQNPGRHSFGSFGVGTSSHIQGELLNLQAGLDLVHVPYAGAAPLVQDLRGGQLDSALVDLSTIKPHLDAVKVLALTGTERQAAVPGVKTFAELGYHSFEPIGWWGFFMPAGAPDAAARRFAEDTQAVLRMPEVIARIEGMGIVPSRIDGAAFAETVRRDAAIYARIIEAAGIKLQ